MSAEKAEIYLQEGRGLLAKGQLKQAQSLLEKSLQFHPDPSIAYNALGVIYKRKKKFDLARERFEKAISINSNNMQPCFNFRSTCLKTGLFDFVTESCSICSTSQTACKLSICRCGS